MNDKLIFNKCTCYLNGFCCKDLDSGRVWDCKLKGNWIKCEKPDAEESKE